MLARVSLLPLLVTTLACPAADDGEPTDPTDPTDPSAAATATATGSESTTTTTSGSTDDPSGADTTGTGTTGMSDPAGAAEVFARLPGLWVGPVDSTTSAGDFPTMNMDVRPADGRTLFSRVDLDGGNSLRFAFAIETHDGEDVLVFRNGGYFLGILRDSRTRLVEADLDAERFTFCSIAMGCEYIRATFDFEGDDVLDMHVDVFDATHFDWPATRAELREQPGPFPSDTTPGAPDAPFPEMPTLSATLTWTTPLDDASDVWIILSSTDCLMGGGCTPSRFIRGRAEAGDTSIVLTLDQIHAGAYAANAMLDRNGNLLGTFAPDAGDTVAVPTAIDVAASGTTERTIPLLVDL
jgi:hypothetical protein